MTISCFRLKMYSAAYSELTVAVTRLLKSQEHVFSVNSQRNLVICFALGSYCVWLGVLRARFCPYLSSCLDNVHTRSQNWCFYNETAKSAMDNP